MTKLTVVPPSVGEEDKNAEPKVGTAIKEIEKWANGEIDGTTNIKAGSVLEANLSTALVEKLTSLTGLVLEKKNESFEAVSGKVYEQEKAGSTITLPAPTLNRMIGVFASGVAFKVKPSAGTIFGDFLNAATAVEFTNNQHAIFLADGSNWTILAGEPKREQEYSNTAVKTKAELEAGIEPSATRQAVVVLYNESAFLTTITVGGKNVAPTAAGGVSTVVVNPGQKVKATQQCSVSILLL